MSHASWGEMEVVKVSKGWDAGRAGGEAFKSWRPLRMYVSFLGDAPETPSIIALTVEDPIPQYIAGQQIILRIRGTFDNSLLLKRTQNTLHTMDIFELHLTGLFSYSSYPQPCQPCGT